MVSKLGRRSSVLTIESVEAHHAGRYTCQGENAAGTASYSVDLQVIGGPAKILKILQTFCILLAGFNFSQ